MSKLTVPRNYIMFKSSSPTCKTDMRVDNLDGYGSVDCLDAIAHLLKVVNVIAPDELEANGLDSTTFNDAKALVIAFNPNSEIADGMLREIIQQGETRDYRAAACAWLKKNPDIWSSAWIPAITWEPEAEVSETSIELILFIGLGTIAFCLIIMYLGQKFGVFQLISDKFLGQLTLNIFGFCWKIVDYAFTWLLFIELDDIAHRQFMTFYLIFIGLHSVAFVPYVYYSAVHIWHVYNDMSDHKDLRENLMTQRNNANLNYTISQLEAEKHKNICNVMGLVFEDTPGVILLIYVMLNFEGTDTMIFCLGMITQCIELGQAVMSPFDLKRNIDTLEHMKERKTAMQDKGELSSSNDFPAEKQNQAQDQAQNQA